jgi:ATP-binding cassette subfamily C protein CydD
MVSIALVAVYLGLSYLGYLNFGAYSVPLTLFGGVFILVLAPEFYLPLRELGTHYHARAKALGAADEILKIMTVKPQTKRRTLPDERIPGQMNISCRDLYLAYDSGSRPALRGVTLEIKAGQHVALVGASGCGKTTLLNLIMGFLSPDAGDIRADGIPLAEINTSSWRGLLSWLGQKPYLFHGTIRENICLSRPQATENEIRRVAAEAHVLSFSENLPQGLDTPVGEQAFGLSRGQAQRVALARAMLKNAPLLLLDEPTTGLDTQSEKLVLEGIERLGLDRTVITVTHRLSSIEKADHIYLMHKGGIEEQGTYQDLMRMNGPFRRMVRSGDHREG